MPLIVGALWAVLRKNSIRPRDKAFARRLSLHPHDPVVRRLFVARMSTIILRGGVELENPLELALEFLAAYSGYEAHDSSSPVSFDESDLRLANRGGARISAAEIAAILERRGEIERALRKIHIDASVGGRDNLDPVDPADTAL